MQELITERYRPKKLEDAFLAPDTRKELSRFIRHGLSEHLTFWGGTGTGKTSVAHILANNESNVDIYYAKYGESDKQDAKINEDIIKRCRSGKTVFGDQRFFILDELDNLTDRGLAKFNALLEDYDKHARFILILNDVTRITDKIASRSLVLQFQHATYDRKKRDLVYYPEFPKAAFNKEIETLLDRILDGEKVDDKDRATIKKRSLSDKESLIDLRKFIRGIGLHITDVQDERLDQA